MKLKETIITALAMLIIGALTAYATSKGLDGPSFLICIGLIAGVAGYHEAKSLKP